MLERPPAALRTSRVDHIGSLLRPQRLKDAFLRYGRNEIGNDELQAAQDDAIRDVIARQDSLDLPFVTDGEYRRLNWQVSFSRGRRLGPVGGFMEELSAKSGWLRDRREALAKGRGRGRVVPDPRNGAPDAHAKLPARGISIHPERHVASGEDDADGPRPGLPDVRPRESRSVYRNPDEFLSDVIAIQQQIVGGLVAAGCDYVQIDEPSYTGYVDPATLDRMKRQGEDPMRNLRRAIEADNAVIRQSKGKAAFGLHVCRGNRASMWHREGKYDAIAEALFGGLEFDRLLLEYDSERAGTFEPLRFVRKGTTAVLGLITTKSGNVETVEALTRRLDEASRYLPLDQLALSPQCGFASGIAGNALTEDEQWRKLDVMMEVARRMWGAY